MKKSRDQMEIYAIAKGVIQKRYSSKRIFAMVYKDRLGIHFLQKESLNCYCIMYRVVFKKVVHKREEKMQENMEMT